MASIKLLGSLEYTSKEQQALIEFVLDS